MFNDARDWLYQHLSELPPSEDNQEQTNRVLTLEYLKHHPRAFWRDEFEPGHITGSAWIVNPARTHVLLQYYAPMDAWYQFGGHPDGEGNIQNVALRESHEEVGVPMDELKLLNNGRVYDIDIHVVAANSKKKEPEHLHYDVRFAYELNDKFSLPPSPEGLTIRWTDINEAWPRVQPILRNKRMLNKTSAL